MGESSSHLTLSEDDLIRRVTSIVRKLDPEYEKEGGSTRHWVRDFFLPALEADGLRVVPTPPPRRVTTPHDDPIVQACVDHGGHFWPADAPEDEASTCTRCWFNPGWKAGKVATEADLRPVHDNPQA